MRARPTLLGRYELGACVGSGGMAAVYTARDSRLDRRVAIKLLADNLAADELFRRRFAREARAAARISHPNVVQIYDVGEDDGRPYIVMEYLEGETLARRLRRVGPLPPANAASIASDVASGLAHAHRAGLVHRDVKPHNILLTPEGEAKLLDFGIAHAIDATAITEVGALVGTIAYLAPEQMTAGTVSPAADVYALGLVLYEALCGRLPWTAESRARGRPVRALRDDVPGSSRALDRLVRDCLRSRPEQRPTAASVAGRLAALAPELAQSPLRTAVGPPTERRMPAPTLIWSAVRTSVLRRPTVSSRRRDWARLRRVRLVAACALAAAAAVTVAAVVTDTSISSPKTPRPVPAPAPTPKTPSAQARALAAWLRAESG